MAVGLACSASGLPAAMRLLEPLMKDAVDFVRQGALIASALVLMQQPESKVHISPLLTSSCHCEPCAPFLILSSDCESQLKGCTLIASALVLMQQPESKVFLGPPWVAVANLNCVPSHP